MWCSSSFWPSSLLISLPSDQTISVSINGKIVFFMEQVKKIIVFFCCLKLIFLILCLCRTWGFLKCPVSMATKCTNACFVPWNLIYVCFKYSMLMLEGCISTLNMPNTVVSIYCWIHFPVGIFWTRWQQMSSCVLVIIVILDWAITIKLCKTK